MRRRIPAAERLFGGVIVRDSLEFLVDIELNDRSKFRP
jgi:hypothetical protein